MGLGASEERIVPIKQEVQAVVVVRHPSPPKNQWVWSTVVTHVGSSSADDVERVAQTALECPNRTAKTRAKCEGRPGRHGPVLFQNFVFRI